MRPRPGEQGAYGGAEKPPMRAFRPTDPREWSLVVGSGQLGYPLVGA
jgi:hypothetical protein